jgi:hypothetical protein
MLVVVGQKRARFQAHRGVPPEAERAVDDDIGGRERRIHVAGVDHLAEREIVAEIRMQHRRLGIERSFLVCHHRQLLPLELDQLRRVLRERARLCHHHDDRLALPAGAMDRHRVLRGRLHAGKAGQRADPGRGATASSAPVITRTTPGARRAGLHQILAWAWGCERTRLHHARGEMSSV